MTDHTPMTEHKVTIDDLIDGWACEHMRADDRLEDVRDAAKKALAAHERKIAAEAWDEGWDACMEYVDGPDWGQAPPNPYRADRIEQGGDDV